MAAECDLRGLRVDVRDKAVAEADVGGDGVVKGRALFAEAPDLAGDVGAVRAEDGEEDGVLEPTGVELPEAEIAAAGVVGVGYEGFGGG